MSKKRVIDVKRQHNMSMGETFGLCIRGVKHRMFRSVLTLSVVVLAVAFFMFLLTESMLVSNTGRGVASELTFNRRGQVLFTKFFTTASDLVTMKRLALAHSINDEVAFKEFASVTGESEDAVRELAKGAFDERTYLDWVDNIPSGKRLILVHKNMGRDAIKYAMSDIGGFKSNLEPMIDLRIPNGREALYEFFANYDSYRAKLTTFNAKWNEKVAGANVELAEAKKAKGDISDANWVITSDKESRDKLQQALSNLGFIYTEEDSELVYNQFVEANLYSSVFSCLNSSVVREEWAKAYRETKRSTTEFKLTKLNDDVAIDILKKHGGFTEEQVLRVYDKAKNNAVLASLEKKLSTAVSIEKDGFALNGRQLFLLVISFIVCMVGITNAMLMSITERFREIATMKCLGATDKYILSQFMMEAGLQGLCGGVVGVFLGFVISVLRGAISYGSYLFIYWSTPSMLICALCSLLAGVLLSILASMQPSWSASRMAPMEAMRVE